MRHDWLSETSDEFTLLAEKEEAAVPGRTIFLPGENELMMLTQFSLDSFNSDYALIQCRWVTHERYQFSRCK